MLLVWVMGLNVLRMIHRITSCKLVQVNDKAMRNMELFLLGFKMTTEFSRVT